MTISSKALLNSTGFYEEDFHSYIVRYSHSNSTVVEHRTPIL